mgnify:CR=1 FL=1
MTGPRPQPDNDHDRAATPYAARRRGNPSRVLQALKGHGTGDPTRPDNRVLDSNVMRTTIIGHSASGKSTLAQTIGDKRSLPVLYLDTVQFLPRWRERPLEEQRHIVRSFMREHRSWVIDGNYSKLYLAERLEAADAIVILKFNRWSCLWRAYRRVLTYRGASRPSMTDGCTEHIDSAFAWWILHAGRDAAHRRQYRSIEQRYSHKTVVITNQRQLTSFVRGL